MQNAKSTVDGLRLLFADAIHYEDLAVEAAKVWDQCVGGSSTSWQPGMSSVGFDFVVSNSDWVSPSQDEDIIPDTARERSEEYSRWSANLKSLSSPVNDIKFYDAAAWVTNLLGFSEGGSTKALLELVTKGRSNIDDTNQLLDQVGERLYEVNSGIYPMLVSGQLLTEDGRLISPRNDDWMLERLRNGYTVNSDGFLVDPQGEVEHGFRAIVVDTAVDWDIHMAYTEQFNVQNVLFKAFEDNGDTFERNVKTINLLLNMGDPRFGAPDWFPVVGEGGTLPFAVEVYQEARGIDTRAVDWAEKARGIDHIDFSVTDDRMAIAMAIVMLEHGFTEDEYLTYLQAITNEDGSIGRSNPPSVFDVLSVSGDQ